ncbi:MAG: hypothetical protein AAB967_03020 [Patescibacteria group bacterium]
MASSETKICQNCKASFEVDASDFAFYEKIKVPPPTFCPNCRMQRRMAWRNERILHKRKSDLSQEEIITYAQSVSPQIKIITRVHQDSDFGKMKILKVDKIIQPEFEGAIAIVRTILLSMGKSKEEINMQTKKLRLSHALA